MAKPLYEEVIEQIGTQTQARLGLNIFSLVHFDASAAYEQSVKGTSDTFRAYHKHKNNPNYSGQTFEDLDVSGKNVADALFMEERRTYTTDTLSDIRKVQDLLRSGKKYENLNPKDQQKFDHIMAHYGDEVKNMDFNDEYLNVLAKGNHNTTDTVTLDAHGRVLSTAQLKKVNHTEELLQDRYLFGDMAVDELRVPFDDYKRHVNNLEEMIRRGNDSDDPRVQEKAQKARIAMDKLKASNITHRLEAENPRASAVIRQTVMAGGNVLQAGLSDAVVVALSTFANGIIWEIKDMYHSWHVDNHTSILTRIKRLFKCVIDSFRETFKRGASFGIIDTVVGVVGQIFTSIAGSLKQLWSQIKTSAKGIWNALYDYVTGKIETVRELLGLILKALFSAAWITGALGLEKKIEMELLLIAPVLAPIAPIVVPIFAIVAGAFAVVVTHRAIDMSLDAIFGTFAAAKRAKKRAEDIADLVAKELPSLMEKTQELGQTIASLHNQRIASLESSFLEYQNACNDAQVYEALTKINHLWGAELKIKNMDDVKNILQNTNRTGKLKW